MGHFNIATEGIRAGRNIFAKLGFGGTKPVPNREDSYSLVAFPIGYKNERQKLIDPLFSLIKVKFNNKEENFFFNCVHRLFDEIIKVALIKKKQKNKIDIKVILEGNYISSPLITVRKKQYDSIE